VPFRLPLLPGRRRAPAGLVIAVFIAVLYGIPNRFPLSTPTLLQSTVVDRAVPFIDWTIWIYGSYFVLLFAPFALCRDDRRAARLFYALVLNSLVAGAIFLAWPTSTLSQQPESGGVTGLLWSALLTVDRPSNCFPSLHVANACVCALSLRMETRAWRYLAPVWALLIVASTLTTKQHFFIDVPSGVLLGLVGYWMAGEGVRADVRG